MINLSGTYVYIESSAPQALGHVALLESPVQQGSLSVRCFDFWYSMDGSTMGTIKIDLQIGSTLLPMWVLSGNQGKKWNPGSFTIPVFPGKFKVRSFLQEVKNNNNKISTNTRGWGLRLLQ